MKICHYDIKSISYDGDVTRIILNNEQMLLVNPITEVLTIQHDMDATWLNIVSKDLFNSVLNTQRMRTFF